MEIKDFKLVGENIRYEDTPNHGDEFNSEELDTLVIHYTAGSSAESAINTFKNPNSKASAHLVIGRDGKIIQLVDFNKKAWHAGKSSYKERSGFNNFSIAIELDNAGPLTKTANTYRSWFGRLYPVSEVMYLTHRNESIARYWHAYTEEQIQAVEQIAELLISAYGIKFILGHEEIAQYRKTDPGPAFPLDKIRNKLLNEGRNEVGKEEFPYIGSVISTALNIRKSPDLEGEKIAQALPKGTKVKILEKKENWLKVKVEIEGWVAAQYIKGN